MTAVTHLKQKDTENAHTPLCWGSQTNSIQSGLIKIKVKFKILLTFYDMTDEQGGTVLGCICVEKASNICAFSTAAIA